MNKKVTLSIPEELHRKMELHRDSIALSNIFAVALSDALSKFEASQGPVTWRASKSYLFSLITRIHKENGNGIELVIGKTEDAPHDLHIGVMAERVVKL
jgi:hypothetical protein